VGGATMLELQVQKINLNQVFRKLHQRSRQLAGTPVLPEAAPTQQVKKLKKLVCHQKNNSNSNNM